MRLQLPNTRLGSQIYVEQVEKRQEEVWQGANSRTDNVGFLPVCSRINSRHCVEEKERERTGQDLLHDE
jgi:hypothetical protein